MAIFADPLKDTSDKIADYQRRDLGVEAAMGMDRQELTEREEAAYRYGKEDETHFVDYCHDMVNTSVTAMQEIRRNQAACFDCYLEKPPGNYDNKEDWQSKVIIPKPFGAVQFAMSVVRKAFDIQFLSVENERDEMAAQMWQKILNHQLGRTFANFPIQFTDASGMGFAIGTSMEMVPQWIPGKGLHFELIEPWKIHRDPDAISRNPQSGMYWIHQEYLDYWVLKKYEKDGRFENVPVMSLGSTDSESGAGTNQYMTRQSITNRKNQMWHRSNYRTMVLTSEYWGTVLDRKGELLLPNATYTIAGNNVISLPKSAPYETFRWPGVSFSPLPHFLRYDGRGLIEGVKSLWEFMCSLLCLHNDNLNWVVNPPTEINIQGLVDQTDIENYPGKQYLTHDTAQGQQVVRPVDRKSTTSDILANLNYGDQRFQEGTFVTSLVQGLPGYRAEVTAREAAQSLEQAMTVFSLIGKNLEDGALWAINAGAETIMANMGYADLAMMLGEEEAMQYADSNSPTGITLPKLTTGTFHVSGISALMRDWEIVKNIREVVMPLFTNELFLPYLKPYKLLQAVEKRLNLRDEGIVLSQAAADQIDQVQQANQEQALLMQQQAQAAQMEQTAMAQEQAGMQHDQMKQQVSDQQAMQQPPAVSPQAAGPENPPWLPQGQPPGMESPVAAPGQVPVPAMTMDQNQIQGMSR